jgi:hypothetical protein
MNSINEISLFGDLYYDYSKLSHSILGCYDYIIAEMFFMNIHSNNNYEFEIDIDDRTIEIQEEFVNQLLFRGLNYKKIYAQMILLFISMIPLHSDNVVRQKAFILNTYRLYNIWINI